MQFRYFFLIILLFSVSAYFGFAQQSTELTLPEGTIVHLDGESINDIAYSPDGGLLAAASNDSILFYDTVTHQEVTRIVGYRGSIYSISFSPDGKKLASGDSTGNVYLLDVATSKLQWIFAKSTSGKAPHRGSVSVSFSPDGKTLASVGAAGQILIWDVTVGWNAESEDVSLNRNYAFGFSGLHGENIDSVSFSPGGRALALGNADGQVYVLNIRSRRIRHTLEGHTDSVLSVAFNPSGLIVASAGYDQTVRLWDVVTGRLRHTLEGHTYDVNSVSFRPDGRILASAGDQTVRLWSVITGKPLRTLYGHTGFVNSVSFSPDGKTLASAGTDGKILLWSVGWPAADVNRDDKVNILDLVLIANEFGKTGENEADVNGDGIINIQDLVLVAGAFGED